MNLFNGAVDGEPSMLDEHAEGDAIASIPVSLEAYIATRSQDAAQKAAKLVQQYARTALWTVITSPIEAALGMAPCRIGVSLMLRRSDGIVSAAIISQKWSITLKGDEAWVDIGATEALSIAYIGEPIRTAFHIPFLSPELKVHGATQVGNYYRFHCQPALKTGPLFSS
jgi:hypothetical protein